MPTPPIRVPDVTKGREAEAPRPLNQGSLPARSSPGGIVSDPRRRRYVEGEPKPGRVMEDGRVCAGWHRTDTGPHGQRHGLGGWYTDVGIKYQDGSIEYATIVTKDPL